LEESMAKQAYKLAIAAAMMAAAFGVPTLASAQDGAGDLDGFTIITGAIRDPNAAKVAEDDSATPELPVVYEDGEQGAANGEATQQEEASASGANLGHSVEAQ
jgi:hypothetical protein